MDPSQHIILQAVVGSRAHGLEVEDSDVGCESIIIEPLDSCILRTFDQRCTKGPLGDITIRSLKCWLDLALKGNPNCLLPLWIPEDKLLIQTPAGSVLRSMRHLLISKRLGRSHMGYMQSQQARLTGQISHGGHGPMRQQLIQEHGYDTKYAMHLLRLGMQGVELLSQQRITLPTPEKSFLLDVRHGRIELEAVLKLSTELHRQLRELIHTSPVPEEPDAAFWYRLVVDLYRGSWA